MTIAKNTNQAKAAIANAHDIRCFSLSNNFSGQPMVQSPVRWGQNDEIVHLTRSEALASELESRHSKLSVSEDGRYTLHIHSNLWYEFRA